MYDPRKPHVLIVMGSDSDMPVMKHCLAILDRFHVAYDAVICSAHRTPGDCATLAQEAAGRGIRVVIAAAGGAAHLAGVIAAHSTLPVIAVPIASTPLAGFDSLLSMVQMPPGIPVATMAVGEYGATNAAIFAMQILAVADPAIAGLILKHKTEMIEKVHEKNTKLSSALHDGARTRPTETVA